MEKIKLRLKKLLELATKGVDGEKTNAKELLEKLLSRHDLKISDIYDTRERTVYYFSFGTKMQRRLMLNIYVKIRPDAESFDRFPGRKKIGLELSKSEYAEFQISWDIYRRELQEQLDITFLAFIDSQNLWADIKDKNKEKTELTEKERKKWLAIYQRSEDIDKINIQKQLASG